ncbi:hypothetical protein H0H92_002040 [Tricholoma furcatifolium]|nr:hypothetical protein H0H92_002040 [Tricholoma furcatifolium]
MSIANTIPVHISTQYVTADLAYRHILEHQEAFCRVLTKHGYRGTYSFHAGFDDETTISQVSEKALDSLVDVADPFAVAIILLSDIVSSTADPSDEDHTMETDHCHGEGQGGGESRGNGSNGSGEGNSGNGADGSGDGQHDGSDGRGGTGWRNRNDRGFQEGPDPGDNDPRVADNGIDRNIRIPFGARLTKAGKLEFSTRGAIDIKLEEGPPKFRLDCILTVNTDLLQVRCPEEHYATKWLEFSLVSSMSPARLLTKGPYVREEDTWFLGTNALVLAPPLYVAQRNGAKWDYKRNIKEGSKPVAAENFDQPLTIMFAIGAICDGPLKVPKLEVEVATHWSFHKRGLLLSNEKRNRSGLSQRELPAHLDLIHTVTVVADIRAWKGDTTVLSLNNAFG